MQRTVGCLSRSALSAQASPSSALADARRTRRARVRSYSWSTRVIPIDLRLLSRVFSDFGFSLCISVGGELCRNRSALGVGAVSVGSLDWGGVEMNRLRAVLAVAVVVAAAGCRGGESASGPTAPLPVDRVTVVSVEATTASTTTATTASGSLSTVSSSTATVAATSAPARPRLTPVDLGPIVDPVPFADVPGMPVPGEVVEVYPLVWMYLPTVFDPTDKNIIPPQPDDIDILTAYGRATAAVYSQMTKNPVPVEPNARVQAAFADKGAKQRSEIFEKRNAEGTHVEAAPDRPSVYRPYVLVSPRSESTATVFDCAVTTGAVVDTNGAVVSGSLDAYGATFGYSTQMVKVDGVWLVADTFKGQTAACA